MRWGAYDVGKFMKIAELLSKSIRLEMKVKMKSVCEPGALWDLNTSAEFGGRNNDYG